MENGGDALERRVQSFHARSLRIDDRSRLRPEGIVPAIENICFVAEMCHFSYKAMQFVFPEQPRWR